MTLTAQGKVRHETSAYPLDAITTRSPTSMKDGCTAAASSCPREAADMGRAGARASEISGTGHGSA